MQLLRIAVITALVDYNYKQTLELIQVWCITTSVKFLI